PTSRLRAIHRSSRIRASSSRRTPRFIRWKPSRSFGARRRRTSSRGSRRDDRNTSSRAVRANPSMASVTIANVEKGFGSTHVIRGVEISIGDGEFCVLVGPSGCGKSTLLRMIAGLEEITKGEIAIGGRVVNRVPPKERDIAMVFQNYALYPHMTVRNNMS